MFLLQIDDLRGKMCERHIPFNETNPPLYHFTRALDQLYCADSRSLGDWWAFLGKLCQVRYMTSTGVDVVINDEDGWRKMLADNPLPPSGNLHKIIRLYVTGPLPYFVYPINDMDNAKKHVAAAAHKKKKVNPAAEHFDGPSGKLDRPEMQHGPSINYEPSVKLDGRRKRVKNHEHCSDNIQYKYVKFSADDYNTPCEPKIKLEPLGNSPPPLSPPPPPLSPPPLQPVSPLFSPHAQPARRERNNELQSQHHSAERAGHRGRSPSSNSTPSQSWPPLQSYQPSHVNLTQTSRAPSRTWW